MSYSKRGVNWTKFEKNQKNADKHMSSKWTLKVVPMNWKDWTRSPSGSDTVMGIESDGEFDTFTVSLDFDSLDLTRYRCGYIRPALIINL